MFPAFEEVLWTAERTSSYFQVFCIISFHRWLRWVLCFSSLYNNHLLQASLPVIIPFFTCLRHLHRPLPSRKSVISLMRILIHLSSRPFILFSFGSALSQLFKLLVSRFLILNDLAKFILLFSVLDILSIVLGTC